MEHLIKERTEGIERLRKNSSAASTTLIDSPDRPVAFWSEEPGGQFRTAVRRRYAMHGYAVVSLEDRVATPDVCLEIADRLDLGGPFTPPLYLRGTAPLLGVSLISASASEGSNHPSFGTADAVPLHVDGTLQPLGFVKSAMLLCESPADEGGETLLFNAVGAIGHLASIDPEAVLALSIPQTLIRQANINGCSTTNLTRVLAVAEQDFLCGYSVATTDRWNPPTGPLENAFSRALTFLSHASQENSEYCARIRLEAGTAILIDNTRLSHGRSAYRDSSDQQRRLHRSLHLHHPEGSKYHA